MPSFSRITDTTNSLRVAQLVGITATAYLAGQEAATVYLFTPSLLDAPAPLLARQWKKTWLKARSITAPLTLALSILFGYLSYKDKAITKYFLTSSLLLFSQFPYSVILIGPYNRRLSSKADSLATTSLDDVQVEANMSPGDTVHELVDRWASLYLGRALLVVIAGVSAVCGSI